MNFYMFSYGLQEVEELCEHSYSGALFTYNIHQGDFFTRISRNIDRKRNFKYMVAIRPYVISPQYLHMISKSISEIAPNRIQVNLISGWIKEEEKDFGGVLGEVNDLSSNVDRSNYLIKYIDAIENIKIKNIDYYVSVTNKFVFDASIKNNSKIIIPYSQYKKNIYDLDNKNVMISVAPTLRETEEELSNLNKIKNEDDMENFTYKQFSLVVEEIKNKGIKEIMLSCWDNEERKRINNFVKQYKETENK
jgi:hypothetical protein